MTHAKRPPPRLQPRGSEAASERHPPPRQGGALSRFSFIDKRYALELLLGRGGMGEVWSAYDRKLGRRVAIKLVPFEGAAIDDAPARLEREYELTRQLKGPAFAEVFAFGTHDASNPKHAYLVMELLDGETLGARLERQGKLSLSEARDCLRGIASALRTAHARGIVHRDLKPSNVFFARPRGGASGVQALDGRAEVVKLLDFGIAKDEMSAERLTRPGMLLGSSQYMSPEQIGAHKDVDTRSDLWSLAVLLFRALTGERPFKGTHGDVFARILQDVPPRATVLERALPRGIDQFFRRALEKHPTMRFQTIDELVEAFEEARSTTTRTPSGPLELDIEWDDGTSARSSVRPTVPEQDRPTRADLQRADRSVATASVDVAFDVDPAPLAVEAPRVAATPRAQEGGALAPRASLATGSTSAAERGRRTIRSLSAAVVVLVAAIVVLAALYFYRFR